VLNGVVKTCVMRRFISYNLQEKLLQRNIMDAEMAGARRTNGISGRLVAKPERKCHLKNLSVNGRIVLIRILKKHSMRMGIGCSSVDIGVTGEVF